jgi:twinkle protein
MKTFEIEIHNQYDLPEGSKYSTCPLCSEHRKKNTEKCLMLDWERGLATCQHCGEVIQLHTYKKKKSEKYYVLPPQTNISLNTTNLSDRVVKWFEGRKISQFTLLKAKITENKEYMPQWKKKMHAINFNYYRNGEIVNIKYRAANKTFKLFKDAELIMYNLDMITSSKDVVIVEGEIDCLSMIECGILHVVSVPNGATLKNINLEYLDNSIEYFENKEKIIFALDNDEPGENLKRELIRRFGAERCYNVDLNSCKDPNEYLCKYGKTELKKRIEEATPMPLENVIFAKDQEAQLADFYLNGLKSGLKCGLAELDNIYTVLTGFYEVVTGIPTHGKSEVVDSRMIGLNLNYGYKCAFVSVENKPTILHIDKILRKILGYKPTEQKHIDSKKYKETLDYIHNNFFFVDFEESYDLEKVLEKVKELVFRKGIKTFVLDPFNKIRYKGKIENVTGISVIDYTSAYLNLIDSFCRKYDVFCSLVPHPNKMKREKGKFEIPSFYDIKGGGEFFDMSPFGLTVYRDFERKTTMIKVLKCKFAHLGSNNEEAFFGYNINNGRYSTVSNLNEILEGEEGQFNHDNSFWLNTNSNEIEIEKETEQINLRNLDLNDYKPDEIPF